MTNNKKGFTLIELLVVIAIIGILSAIGLVSLNGAREKARDSKAKSDLATLRTALALYYDDHSFAYPGEAVNATADLSLPSSAGTATGIWLTTGPIITEYMADLRSPSAGQYGYISSSPAAGGAAMAFAVFYNLEGSGGTYYYSVLSTGGVADVAQIDTTAPSCTDDAGAVAGVCTN